MKKVEYVNRINNILITFFGEQYKIFDLMSLRKESVIILYEALNILKQKRIGDYKC